MFIPFLNTVLHKIAIIEYHITVDVEVGGMVVPKSNANFMCGPALIFCNGYKPVTSLIFSYEMPHFAHFSLILLDMTIWSLKIWWDNTVWIDYHLSQYTYHCIWWSWGMLVLLYFTFNSFSRVVSWECWISDKDSNTSQPLRILGVNLYVFLECLTNGLFNIHTLIHHS